MDHQEYHRQAAWRMLRRSVVCRWCGEKVKLKAYGLLIRHPRSAVEPCRGSGVHWLVNDPPEYEASTVRSTHG